MLPITVGSDDSVRRVIVLFFPLFAVYWMMMSAISDYMVAKFKYFVNNESERMWKEKFVA
jgi:hypothetical protein